MIAFWVNLCNDHIHSSADVYTLKVDLVKQSNFHYNHALECRLNMDQVGKWKRDPGTVPNKTASLPTTSPTFGAHGPI